MGLTSSVDAGSVSISMNNSLDTKLLYLPGHLRVSEETDFEVLDENEIIDAGLTATIRRGRFIKPQILQDQPREIIIKDLTKVSSNDFRYEIAVMS